MTSMDLRYRQVHLDFHTSPDIEGVAADFDPEEFVQALLKAEVNSITCFARCHHGMLYYDSACLISIVNGTTFALTSIHHLLE